MFEGSSILITGGTGSFGQAFVERLVQTSPNLKRLVIYSRDELKQYEMSNKFSTADYPYLRYFIGDVRDASRLRMAMEGIDLVVHAAAMKQVPAAEYNPFEAVKTNILGAQNLIEACLSANVKKVVALSTDKAAAPVNLYGATKLCSDKLFVAANNITGGRNTRFSIVRYGNVMGSRGSVIPFFLEQRKTGTLPITDEKMTRFNISLNEGIELVLWAFENAIGGEIIVPKIPSYRITDLAEAIAPDCDIRIIGQRPGEKIHEEMITINDSMYTLDLGPYYVILPSPAERDKTLKIGGYEGVIVDQGFSYNSGQNKHFLSVSELRDLIEKYLHVSV